jgi:hypothetical protein
MNNLPPNTNLVTLSTEWDMMEDYESRNRLRSTSNNNTQGPTTRFSARALPQNTMGDGMNNPHEAVSIANFNINYNRLVGPHDRFSLDKLRLPTPPDNGEGKARYSANSHSHSLANPETNGELLDSLSKNMENLSTNETTLTGSIPRLSSLTNGRSPAMGVPFPYENMHSPLTNGPMNETKTILPSKATFRDHKNGEPDFQIRHEYPHGYTGSCAISTPSRHQPAQTFLGNMGNAYTGNGYTLGTVQNSLNNNTDYRYINGQTNSQKYAAQSATSRLGEPEASEPPQHISNAIVIKNIPFGVKIEQLKRLMEDLKLPTPYAFNYHFDKENLFRGLAFANFHHDWEATEVIQVLNGYKVDDRALRVELKIMLKPGERETAEREKRMKRGQLQEQHKPVSPDMIESLPRLFNPESPIPAPGCSYASGGQQQHDIPPQRRLPASVFEYKTSGNLAPLY